MTILKRLRMLTAIVGSAAAFAAIGTVVFGDIRTAPKSATPVANAGSAIKLVDDAAKTKFSDIPAIAYSPNPGETQFAWQLRPTLTTEARSKDVLVMVDTSASQAGDPIKKAAEIVSAVSAELGPDDRLDIWTVNLDHREHTRSLTKGFQSASDKAIKKAIVSLVKEEYAAGAVDLKAGLESAMKQFDGKAGRQQVLLYLGDGESAAGTPISEGTRVDLGKRLVEKNIQFFSVPLGLAVSANTLHGFGMLTGGTVVRAREDLGTPAGRFEFAKRLNAALDVPVLTVETAKISPNGAELLPAQLPPLRADRSTLVVGAFKGDGREVSLELDGTVNGKKTSLKLKETLPASKSEHYFLAAMIEQWRGASSKDAPVVLAGDRALAMASEQFRLYRDEFVELALGAIAADRLDHAEKLFAAAKKIDPAFGEADSGLKVVAKLRSGEITKDKLKKKSEDDIKAGAKAAALQLPEVLQPPGFDPKPLPTPTPVQPGEALISQAQAAQKQAEAEASAIVDDTLRRVRQVRENDPDAAYEDLKKQRETVLSLDKLSEPVRKRLVGNLETAMSDVLRKSSETKRRLAAERERISRARAILNEYEQQMTQDEQTKARIDRFRSLMHQAKFELAYREAQVMEQERINRGLIVPPEVYATYRIGQSATQLREQKEMKRLREDRYLLTMMQVEKSFVPYPDEPPVHFPPASVWRELRGRREKYEFKNQTIGADAPKSLRNMQSIIEGTHDIPGLPKRVKFESSLKGTSLGLLLSNLEAQFQKQIKFVIRDELFRAISLDLDNIREKQFQTDANLTGMTLGSFLDIALGEFKGSFIVRPDYIEITTQDQRLEQKVTRVFEIGDLALAPPNPVNPAALQQNLAVFGSQLQFFGQGIGQAQQFGQLGNAGGFGGGIGGGNFGQGGGALGAPGGALGAPGGALGGQQGGGALGAVGQQGGLNLGVQGGVLGVTGGQLGQFGNLGGQFGIQGNNQSNVLIQVISQLVARGEWDVNFSGVAQVPQDPNEETPTFLVKPSQLNSLGFYPVTNALIVRATSRYHPVQSFKFPRAGDGAIVQGPKNDNGNVIAAGPNAIDEREFKDASGDATKLVKASGKDPKKIWNATFEAAVTDPELVVTAAEFLFEFKEYQHASEALKANLRKGHATGAWAYEALTLALQSSQGSPVDIERAAMSAIDLDPNDPKAYLRAAKAQNELGRQTQAIELCQRAAEIEPNMPAIYANALAYAEKATDVKADVVVWATQSLLRSDWPNDGFDHAGEAKKSTERIAAKFAAANRDDDAAQLRKIAAVEKVRDLTIELLWQGQGDLDLSVVEPSGTQCSATAKRSSGGGILRSDILEQTDENKSEIYSAGQAFPGTYTVKVKTGLGTALGNRATLKVTKGAGTEQQTVELFTVDLAKEQAIEVKLETGHRTELATVLDDDVIGTRIVGDANTSRTAGQTGVTAGFGGADAATLDAVNTSTNGKSVAPLVGRQQEVRLPGISASLPSMRLVGKVRAGSDVAEYTATPVFVGKAVDLPMPKVQLLPGASARR